MRLAGPISCYSLILASGELTAKRPSPAILNIDPILASVALPGYG